MPAREPHARDARRPRILVIRRDNIGDLVCTLPLLRGLREAHPNAWIAVFANTYNASVLDRNPDLDTYYAYRKLKHQGGVATARLVFDRLRLIRELRARELDDVVLATPAFHKRNLGLARWLRPRRVVGFAPADEATGPDMRIPLARADRLHEVERVLLLGAAFGVEPRPFPARVFPDPLETMRFRAALARRSRDDERPLIGVHISARKPSQRWPGERFAALMHALREQYGASFVLFWSPGASDNPQHPGDDAKAQEVHTRMVGVPCLRWPTESLPELMAGLAECDTVICADGGAMHLAAALGKPIVCLFGDSDAVRWRPWGVPYELLQTPGRDVNDIRVEDVVGAYEMLSMRISLLAAG